MCCKGKKFITLGILLALTLSTIPVLAFNLENNNRESGIAGPTFTFHTLTKVPGAEPSILTVMTEDQLGAIVGAGNLKRRFRVPRITAHNVGGNINVGINIAVSPQINVCAVCAGVVQNNAGAAFQRITFR